MPFNRFQTSLSSEASRPSLAPALRTVAMLVVASAGVAYAGAQTSPSQPAQTQTALTSQLPALDVPSTQLFSSSVDPDTTTEASLSPNGPVNFADYMGQYGGGQRRRYGAPRYRGSNTTADGTPKYTFIAGAGFEQTIGNTWKYFTPSYSFQVGGGRNFDRHLGLLLQFDYDHLGLSKSTLQNQSFLYFNDSNPSDNGLDGSAHVWSFSLNPVYTIAGGGNAGGFGAYMVAGVGFYHKVTTFTVPQEEEYCDPYYGCENFEVNGTFDHYSSNAPGFNGGFGVTYKFSRFSNERFYAEARYVFVDNSQRQGVTINNYATQPATATNIFPANSNRTTYIPIKFGIRF